MRTERLDYKRVKGRKEEEEVSQSDCSLSDVGLFNAHKNPQVCLTLTHEPIPSLFASLQLKIYCDFHLFNTFHVSS